MIILICSDGRKRPLRSRRRRLRKKVFFNSSRRQWDLMTWEEKEPRLKWLAEQIFAPKCESCGDVLGENFDCDTCVASWPELTEEDKTKLDSMSADFIERLFAEERAND